MFGSTAEAADLSRKDLAQAPRGVALAISILCLKAKNEQ
jgi:hypothetical protein